MVNYYLSEKEDLSLYHIVMYRNGRSLYEYMIEMPIEDLKAYPRKGYRWWMGRKAKAPEALEMRDYVLHWRIFAQEFREEFPADFLEALSTEKLTHFLKYYLEKTPTWAYDAPVKDAARIFFYRTRL